jgi:hypothetical protein
MRRYTWIILLFSMAILGGGIYLFLNKKKKKEFIEAKPPVEPETKRPLRESKYDPSVATLQKHINEQLPSDYPKLAIDGIMGPKTKAAIKYLETHKDDSVTQKIIEIAEDLSPIGVAKKIMKTEENAIQNGWSWIKKHVL